MAPPTVIPSPEHGYRMRARLHARQGRLGFVREGTHDLCEAVSTGQLLPATGEWLATAQQILRDRRLDGLAGVELAENIPGDERACHLDLHSGVDPAPFAVLAPGLAGLSARCGDHAVITGLGGTPVVRDVLHLRDGDAASALRLRRNARAFFQGNRFLVERLARHVVSLVPDGPAVDLYAGVGLFGLSLAAAGGREVTLVEGDPVSGADLRGNAEAFPDRVHVERRSVETFLESTGPGRPSEETTVIVDPPRTGMSTGAARGLAGTKPKRIVYVSCDVATLARDARALVDAGYEVDQLTGFDLFPNTAHVEAVAVFNRAG